MRKNLFKISSLMMVLIIMLSSVGVTAFAAEELNINSEITVQKGDKITFNINLADCDKKVVGLQMYLNYDNTKLKYVENSLKFEKFDSVIYNAKLENQIAITWTNIMEEADFSSKASFLTAEFEVIGTGETSISQYISHMYNLDMESLTKYTFTYDYKKGDGEEQNDKPAVITSDETFLNTHTGSFVNYDDGVGENSSNKEHKVVKGVEIVTKVVAATKYVIGNEDGSDKDSKGSGMTLFIIIAVVVVILAIAAVIIVKKRDEAKKKPKYAGSNTTVDEE